VRRYVPNVAERIFDSPCSVAVELVLYGALQRAAGSDSLRYSRVNVVDVQMDMDRRSAA
jgi:hypothetical protein